MSAVEIKYYKEDVGIEVDNSETTLLSSVLHAYRPWICLPVPFKEVRLRSCHLQLIVFHNWNSVGRP